MANTPPRSHPKYKPAPWDHSHEHHFHGPLPYFKTHIGLRFEPNFKVLALIALALLALFFYRRVLILVALLALVILWDVILHYFHFPVHIEFLPFASFFVSYQYGIPVAVAFILIGSILPELFAGHFHLSDMLSFAPLIAVNIIFFSATPASFYTASFIALVSHVILSAGIAAITNPTPIKFAIEPAAILALNLLLIYRLGPVLLLIT